MAWVLFFIVGYLAGTIYALLRRDRGQVFFGAFLIVWAAFWGWYLLQQGRATSIEVLIYNFPPLLIISALMQLKKLRQLTRWEIAFQVLGIVFGFWALVYIARTEVG